MIVVLALELGEIAPLSALLAHPLDLGEHLRHQLGLGRDPGVAERMLDHERPGMLAVDVGDLGAEVGGRHELVDRGMDQHARGVDA